MGGTLRKTRSGDACSILFLIFAASALSAAQPLPVPASASSIGTRRGWNVFLAEPCADTVSAKLGDVVPAIRRTLEADEWRIERADVRTGEVRTRWKELHHPLVRMLMGRIEARCAVDARPFQSGETIVIFQGGIAAKEHIEDNPGLVLAKRAYRNAARDWRTELRADLARRNELRVEAR